MKIEVTAPVDKYGGHMPVELTGRWQIIHTEGSSPQLLLEVEYPTTIFRSVKTGWFSSRTEVEYPTKKEFIRDVELSITTVYDIQECAS